MDRFSFFLASRSRLRKEDRFFDMQTPFRVGKHHTDSARDHKPSARAHKALATGMCQSDVPLPVMRQTGSTKPKQASAVHPMNVSGGWDRSYWLWEHSLDLFELQGANRAFAQFRDLARQSAIPDVSCAQ